MRPRFLLVAYALAAGACAGRTPAPTREFSVTGDSLRGNVERVGNEPESALLIRAANGATCALVSPAPPPPLAGLEVVVWGARRAPSTPMPGVACAFAVERYAVRAVDGVAAQDGILRFDAGDYALETADGRRHPLRAVPSALQTQVGARVYWAGPRDRAPTAYGILTPPPK
ncbi:MAG: hypothetical protein FJ363_11835 [Gemmatimonadetes bacterium]|nr:hypothetical protein [Gemmatimonadota bacterium]